MEQTLEEARNELRKHVRKGMRCPLCTQLAKVYRRKLNSSMAMMLIEFYKMTKGTNEFHCLYDLIKRNKNLINARGGDFAKLKYWDLLEQQTNDSEKDTRTSGFWRLTDEGRKFSRNEMKIEPYILLYDGRLLKKEGDRVLISQCLKSHFSYTELMND